MFEGNLALGILLFSVVMIIHVFFVMCSGLKASKVHCWNGPATKSLYFRVLYLIQKS